MTVDRLAPIGFEYGSPQWVLIAPDGTFNSVANGDEWEVSVVAGSEDAPAQLEIRRKIGAPEPGSYTVKWRGGMVVFYWTPFSHRIYQGQFSV